MLYLFTLIKNLLKGPATEAFPFGEATTPPRYRGRVAFDAAACAGCRMCEHVCAAGAIRFSEEADGLHFALWHNSCVFCGMCEFHCPTQAIRLTTDWHLAHAAAEKYAMAEAAVLPYRPCAGCGKPMLPAVEAMMRRAFRRITPETARLGELCPDCRRTASLPHDPGRFVAHATDGRRRRA